MHAPCEPPSNNGMQPTALRAVRGFAGVTSLNSFAGSHPYIQQCD